MLTEMLIGLNNEKYWRNEMSENRLVVELRNHHPLVWKELTNDQRRKALDAANGQADRKSLERAYKIARKGN